MALVALVCFEKLVRAWSAGTFSGTKNHHGELALRGARCMGQTRKLVPSACRIKSPLDAHVLEDALKRGAAEPDLALPFGDGTGSSKHSLNARLSAGAIPAILGAYGAQVRDAAGNPLTIVPGKAAGAIQQERAAIAADLVVIGANCQADAAQQQEQYNRLWFDLGRLSHYVADLHSPFHANSFGVAELQDDYHEGVIAPSGNGWIKGLWDRGPIGQLTHGKAELDMGGAAGIGRLSCTSGPVDPVAMAQQAIQTMDGYQSIFGPHRGYAGLMYDFDFQQSSQIDPVQVAAWGPPRAAAAIGSTSALFDEMLRAWNPPSCGETSCDPPNAGPGGDTPDDSSSQSSGVAPGTASRSDEVIDGFRRLATKKGRRQLIDWQLLMLWEGERLAGRMLPEKLQAYVGALGLRRDEHQYFQDYLASADVSVLANGFALRAGDLLQEGFVEPIMRVGAQQLGPGHVADHPVLVVPTGGLSGLWQNDQFGTGLERYVRAGGTAVVFSQQLGSDYSALPTPEGRPIHGWGGTRTTPATRTRPTSRRSIRFWRPNRHRWSRRTSTVTSIRSRTTRLSFCAA